MKISKIKSKSLNDEVKSALIGYIKKMDLSKSNKLPREEILADKLGVSRITIRGVLSELSQEGIIFRKHGKGTFVNPDVLDISVSFNPALEFDQIIKNSGHEPRIDVISLEERVAEPSEIDKLQLEDGSLVIVLKKIVYADETPAIFCTDVIPKDIFSGKLSKSDFKKSIFSIIKSKTSRIIARDIVEISSVLTTDMHDFEEYTEKSSSIKPMLLCRCVNYDSENHPIIYGNIFYDTSFIKFSLLRQMDNMV